MTDYAGIGRKVKQIRTERGVTQEELAEAAGVTHISHLETDSEAVSLKVFPAIVNHPECSADELLFREIASAGPIVNNWLSDLVADCDQTEIKIISDMVMTLKQTLRKNKSSE